MPETTRIWVLKIPLDVQKTTKQRFRGPFPEPKGAQTFRAQVKHFLGCKKSTKSNTCGSLFTCSGALLFSSTKTAKFQNPCISGHGCFCVHFVPRFDARDSSPEPETPQIFASRPWQFVGWRQAQKNGKKWVSFNASFTPPCQFFRGFRLFRPFLIFIVGLAF